MVDSEVPGDKLLSLMYNLLGKGLSRVAAKVVLVVAGVWAIQFVIRQVNAAIDEIRAFNIEGINPGDLYLLIITPILIAALVWAAQTAYFLATAVWRRRLLDDPNRERDATILFLRQILQTLGEDALTLDARVLLESHLEYLERPRGLRGWWLRRRSKGSDTVQHN